MNKVGLIEKIAEATKVSKKEVEAVIDSMLEVITTELQAGGKVNLVGFGAFIAKTRHSRGGVNPQHPSERIKIPEVMVAKFKTGKALKDALKGKAEAASVSAATAEEKEEEAAS